MAAAVGASHAGWDVRLFERAAVFSEVGAGIQLGPNVVRCLQAWDLQAALLCVAAVPQRLYARNANNGQILGCLPLGTAMVQRYGAHYVTVHRADLLRLLMDAARSRGDVHVNAGQSVLEVLETERAGSLSAATTAASTVTIRTSENVRIEGDALLLADGVWSHLRGPVLGDHSRPCVSGHLAYRALLPMQDVPVAWRTNEVNVWLGPRLHVVHYPVRAGEMLNLVVIVEGVAPDNLEHWDHAANAAALDKVLKGTCTALQDVVHSVGSCGQQWRLWPLSMRSPLMGAHHMAKDLVALAGDAAHPMLPYLAQGAGMAIEDAVELQRALGMEDLDVALRLRRYALNRWQRNARVQARAIRNGHIFHATGAVRWARDMSMHLLGSRVMDVPWLYQGHGVSMPEYPPNKGI